MGTGVVLAELLRSTGLVEREIRPPSLKRSAKTFAPTLYWETREAMRKKADETERLQSLIVKVRRGVTVVGD
jgi:hypothetical protein